ncbi:helix-turn-helix domain-containing protein [Nocardia fluminea]|uniref:helix-turn-helix domain-containing protein n=1 Tax=Nocardia fluminea TaxID=134984 RepID=UPI0033CCA24C
MARKPDVFVRAVTPEEGRKLAQIARRSKVPVRMRRAVVVMASAQHQPFGLIAKLMQVSESYVRQVIHDFNAHGFEALDPNGGARTTTSSWCSCRRIRRG